MKNTIINRSFLLVAFLTLWQVSVRAFEYGDHKLFAHFDFENGTTDVMGNVDATATGLQLVDDAQRGGKVVSFSAAGKGNLKMNTNPVAKEFTLAFWYKRDDADATTMWRMPFAFYAPDGSNIFFTPLTNWNNLATLVLDNKPYSVYKTISGKTAPNKTWIHLAMVFNGSECSLYMDGALMGSAMLTSDLTEFGTTEHYFGNYPANNYSMTGSLDDIRIYHEALVENQIMAVRANEPVPDPVNGSEAFVKLDFSNEAIDVMGNVPFVASDVTFTRSDDKREVAQFTTNSSISATLDPVGKGKYTVSMLYKKEKFENTDNDRQLWRFSTAPGDYIALMMRVTDGVAKLEMERSVDGKVTKSGQTTASLKTGEWNAIVCTQIYSEAGTGAVRVYINGVAKVSTGIASKSFDFTQWTVGANAGNAAGGMFDEILFYKRELLSAEVESYGKSMINSIQLSLNPEKSYQTIRNFGGSDGWTTQPVGLYLNQEKKERLAEMLFSTEMDENGNPKGIGMSAWRFNIGAGTYEQRESSRISDETRRTECFLNADKTTYDWSKQAGQRFFLERAVKKYNVPDIIGWQNSPPVMFTKRGLGFREVGDAKSSILKPEYYADFGNFLAEVVNHFKGEGISFKYISPLNEPQFDWQADATTRLATQEGSPWSNQEISDVVKAINTAFVNKGIESKLFLSEAGNIRYLLNGGTGFAENQLNTLWGPTSDLRVGHLSTMSNIVSSHSYWEDNSAKSLVETRKKFRQEIDAIDPNLEFFQTEYCLLGSGYAFGHPATDPVGNLSPMQCGVSLSRVIHADLALANATGWQWWTTFEMDRNLNTTERFALIRIALNKNKTDGVYRATKLMYTFGNYSFFIRPGMKRIELTRDDNMTDIDQVTNQMFTAYTDEATGKVVIVATNASMLDCGITLPALSMGEDRGIVKYTPYITSEKVGDDLKCYPVVNAGQHFVMPATSVITFVGEVENANSLPETKATVKVVIAPNPAVDQVAVRADREIRQIMISDMTGKIVCSEAVGTDEWRFSTEKLEGGIYFVTVITAGEVATQKLIVKK